MQFLRWHIIHKLRHDCTGISLGHIINNFPKELLTTLLISFSHFILIFLSLQSGMTFFYSSTNPYNSIASRLCKAKDVVEIKLTEEVSKDEYKTNDLLTWWIVIVVLCLVWACTILFGSKILPRGSGCIPAECQATVQKYFSDPKMLSTTGKLHWTSLSDHQLLSVMMAFVQMSVMVPIFLQSHLCFVCFS